jgi:hypothetical protein
MQARCSGTIPSMREPRHWWAAGADLRRMALNRQRAECWAEALGALSQYSRSGGSVQGTAACAVGRPCIPGCSRGSMKAPTHA